MKDSFPFVSQGFQIDIIPGKQTNSISLDFVHFELWQNEIEVETIRYSGHDFR